MASGLLDQMKHHPAEAGVPTVADRALSRCVQTVGGDQFPVAGALLVVLRQ